MSKITKATFKSFVKLWNCSCFIKVKSKFNGMIDGVEQLDNEFTPLLKDNWENKNCCLENTLGYLGIWLVGSSRDYFKNYVDDTFFGIEVSNCCGRFIVAVKK
jgi:hypothetical protein